MLLCLYFKLHFLYCRERRKQWRGVEKRGQGEVWHIITVCPHRFVNSSCVLFIKSHLPKWKLYSAIHYSRYNRQSYISVFVHSLILMSCRALKYSETPNKLKFQNICILISSVEEQVTLFKFIPTTQQDKFKKNKSKQQPSSLSWGFKKSLWKGTQGTERDKWIKVYQNSFFTAWTSQPSFFLICKTRS